jgi:hypothetical protein
MTFTVGDTVRCVFPNEYLVLNHHYVIRNVHDYSIQVEGKSDWFYSNRFVPVDVVVVDKPPPEALKKIVLNEKAKLTSSNPSGYFSDSRLWLALRDKVPHEWRGPLFENLLAKWKQGKIRNDARTIDEAFAWHDQPEGWKFWDKLYRATFFNEWDSVPWEKLND